VEFGILVKQLEDGTHRIYAGGSSLTSLEAAVAL